ncbi:UTRA domain-containing protein [bacterium]|nr:UTRA domain-containing protein [bacterium]
MAHSNLSMNEVVHEGVHTLPTAQLDRNSFVPLYHQLYELLRAQLESGVYQPGDKLPTEAEFCELYGISQITIRQSLNMLVDAGLIDRRKGKGTFVTKPAITSVLRPVFSIAEDMRQRGLTHRAELLDSGTAPVSQHTARALNVAVGDEVVYVSLLHYADGEPLCVERASILHSACPNLLQHDVVNEPLMETLRREYDVVLTRAGQTVWAQQAGEEYALLLQTAPEDPLLVVERIVYSQHNQPVEFSRIFYRGDRYALQFELG